MLDNVTKIKKTCTLPWLKKGTYYRRNKFMVQNSLICFKDNIQKSSDST